MREAIRRWIDSRHPGAHREISLVNIPPLRQISWGHPENFPLTPNSREASRARVIPRECLSNLQNLAHPGCYIGGFCSYSAISQNWLCGAQI